MDEENKQAEQPKNNKKAKIIGNTIFFTAITLMVTFFVWNFIDIKSGYKYPIFGMRTSVIVSPSMATVNEANTYITSEMKQIQKNDVVTTVNYKNYDDIKLYDIATYYTGSKNLICHRVVDKYVSNGVQYVVFRGDANNIDDVPVSYDLVRGKVVSITPKVGHVVSFIQSPYLFIALFGTAFFVALGLFIADRGKEKKKAVPEQEEPNNENQVENKEEPVSEEKPTEEQAKEEESTSEENKE